MDLAARSLIPAKSQKISTQLSTEDRIWLRVQRALSHLSFPVLVPLGWHLLFVNHRYRFSGIEETRRVFAQALETGRPTIVCANHLTIIDSVLLYHALASPLKMFSNFRCFQWNVPAAENFKNTFQRSLLTYLIKCVPIHRQGSREHKQHVLETLRWLLARGEVVTIFPEGTRSRSGRFDHENLAYGVGEILARLPDAQVVCVYLRGEMQHTFSYVPADGDRIDVTASILEPRTQATGMRAARDLTRQIGSRLAEMEAAYFAKRA